ncbi:rcc01693 family protein [Rhabdaerophilum calidifontis]|uniref:rcc01693 family protein n=1 Tax=Rhabdaerophilum calidifontis TaxID=2604328 RepID=UPI00319DED4B
MPWPDMLAFGLGILALPPDAFWRLTLPEFLAALEARTGRRRAVSPLGRAEFAALMARFPDDSVPIAARSHPHGA